MGGEEAVRINAGNLRKVNAEPSDFAKRAEHKEKPFGKEPPMAELNVIVLDGSEKGKYVHERVELGSNLQSVLVAALRKHGMIVLEQYDEKEGLGICKVVTKDGTIKNVHYSFRSKDGKRKLIPLISCGNGGISGAKAADILITAEELTVVIENSTASCSLGNTEPTGPVTKQRLQELLLLDMGDGTINPSDILLSSWKDPLPPRYLQPLATIETGGFEMRTGFVPNATFVQDFASSNKLREWLKDSQLKVGCEGELDIILYYNGIGTRGIEWNPARVEAPVLPSAERREFVAAASGNEVAVQECRSEAAPASQQAPMQFAYDAFESVPTRFRKEKRVKEKPVEAKNVARAESKVERKEKLVRREKAGYNPSAKRAAEEAPFWRIDSKGRMKPMHAPRGMDDGAPAQMPKLKVGVPKLMGKLVFRRENTSPVRLNRVAEAKNPELLQEKKKKRKRRPEMKQVGAERPAEKPKRPAAKVRFGDAVPLSSGIRRKKVRREMPVVELKKEKKAKRRAEKRKEIALGQDAAISTKRKAHRKEKAVMLDAEGKKKSRMEEKKRARKRQADTVEYLVAKKARGGKRKYWAPLSLR
ncbi:MAG: hypothetical protein WC350_00980 [Candidatus Micrarchaeia archaeon]|jgi:hypothetical protein